MAEVDEKPPVRGCGATWMAADPVTIAPFESLAFAEIAWLPLAANVVVKLMPVPEDGFPPTAVQVIV